MLHSWSGAEKQAIGSGVGSCRTGAVMDSPRRSKGVVQTGLLDIRGDGLGRMFRPGDRGFTLRCLLHDKLLLRDKIILDLDKIRHSDRIP